MIVMDLTAQKGLTSEVVAQKLNQFGLNELPNKSSTSVLKLIIAQFNNLLTFLLLLAVVLSFIAGDPIDGWLIITIIILNSGLGFYQEFKASKELEALKKMEVSTIRVIRDGVEKKIFAKQLVPGDLILLEAGDKVPADAQVIEAANLTLNEASLTGESISVIKTPSPDENQIYLGTTVTTGRAKAIITTTGEETRFGKIAINLANVEEEQTPLEKSLAKLARNIGIFSVFIALLLFGIRILQGYPFGEVFFTSIALMVAAVPEGLPAIITILLALGVRKMYHKKTLVRKLSAIESLGAATVICTDKTGTLTKNQMRVKTTFNNSKDEHDLLLNSVLCNSASLVMKEGTDQIDVLGDTTEGALLIWAQSKGLDITDLRAEGKILEELPFNLKLRMMSVLWQDPQKNRMIYSKGAPESILPLCNLTSSQIDALNEEYTKMASLGLRVLAFSEKKLPINFSGSIEKTLSEMKFLGLVGIADAARSEAKEAIAKAKSAGIKVIMITGDNELTAKSIGKEVGLLTTGDEIVTGVQLDEMSDQELSSRLFKIRIFARVIPEHKLRIVQALQASGEVVAVTGDGVNDALALKQAQVGVAMGITGTDVAKEAADIIILDDNFQTIVSAVEQGRLIYDNIVKIVKFLLAGNLSEVLIIVVSVLVGFPTPLAPVQILWINFVTDGLPALSLAADSATANIMNKSPNKDGGNLLTSFNTQFILLSGGIIALICLTTFFFSLQLLGLEIARSITFNMMVLLQMIFIFVIRKGSIFSNKYLLISVLAVILMQILITTFPPLQEAFKIAH